MEFCKSLLAGCATLFTFALPVLGQSVVVDLETSPTPADSDPRGFFEFSGRTYFTTITAGSTRLWSSDGTAGGTLLVKEWQTLAPRSVEPHFTQLGSELVFRMTEQATGNEIWKTDGTTAGTVLVKDVFPGTSGSSPLLGSGPRPEEGFVEHSGALFFTARADFVNGTELWRTDGTEAGTWLVADLYPGNAGSDPRDLVSFGSHLYFLARRSSSDEGLFKTDGFAITPVVTASSTVGFGNQRMPEHLNEVGGRLVFTAPVNGGEQELWSSDGTTAGTGPYSSIYPGGNADPQSFVAAGGLLFFQAETNSASGKTLFRTDGTAAGTFELQSSLYVLGGAMGAGAAAPFVFVVFNAAQTVRELWISDGTVAGTKYVMDLAASPLEFIEGPVGAYFFNFTGLTSSELWHTDGTAAGTLEVTSFPGICSRSGRRASDGRFWFGGFDPVGGCEPSTSDGTVSGTGLVANLRPDLTANADPNGIVRVADDAYFSILRGGQSELCVTDGSAAGTRSLGVFATTDNRLTGAGMGGRFVFRGLGLKELWITNVGGAGVHSVFDFAPLIGSSGSSQPLFSFVDAGDQVFFTALTNTYGRELWRTDGTQAGTRVLESQVGSSGSFTFGGFWKDPYLYYGSSDGVSGGEPWISDGTKAGTRMLEDIVPGPGGSGAAFFVEMGDKVYFTADTPATGREVWSTKGAPGTTRLAFEVGSGALGRVRSLVSTGDMLFLLAEDEDDPNNPGHPELWVSNGKQGGTQRLANLPLSSATFSTGLLAAGSRVYFYADGGFQGISLWTSDGTTAGTIPLHAFPLWNFNSFKWGQAKAAGSGDTLLFYALDANDGEELWMSDGTVGGTLPLTAGNNPGAAGTDPEYIERAGASVFFAGNDPVFGRELFSVPLAQLGESVLETFGLGCPGTAGLRPRIALSGSAHIGSTVTVGLRDAAPSQPAFLFFSPDALPTPMGACTFFVGVPRSVRAQTTTVLGDAVQSFSLPPDPALIGVGAYFQWAVLDPAGPLPGPATLSSAAEIRLGP